LTDAEIEGFSTRLIAQVEKATGGQLRGWPGGTPEAPLFAGGKLGGTSSRPRSIADP